MTPDLIALLESGLRAKPPRGDEHLAHMSDGICDRQTYYRRSGEETLPHAFATLVKFELGHQFERGIGDILEEHFAVNSTVQRDVECDLLGVVGHADFVVWPDEAELVTTMAEPFLLELKSTSFLRGKIPEAASSWYVEQAALYAAALNIAKFGILVGCRESGKLAPIFWFNLDDQRYDEAQTWREWATARAEGIATVTDPAAPMPPAEPRTGWACRTCNFTQCEKNQNPARITETRDLIVDLDRSIKELA